MKATCTVTIQDGKTVRTDVQGKKIESGQGNFALLLYPQLTLFSFPMIAIFQPLPNIFLFFFALLNSNSQMANPHRICPELYEVKLDFFGSLIPPPPASRPSVLVRPRTASKSKMTLHHSTTAITAWETLDKANEMRKKKKKLKAKAT